MPRRTNDRLLSALDPDIAQAAALDSIGRDDAAYLLAKREQEGRELYRQTNAEIEQSRLQFAMSKEMADMQREKETLDHTRGVFAGMGALNPEADDYEIAKGQLLAQFPRAGKDPVIRDTMRSLDDARTAHVTQLKQWELGGVTPVYTEDPVTGTRRMDKAAMFKAYSDNQFALANARKNWDSLDTRNFDFLQKEGASPYQAFQTVERVREMRSGLKSLLAAGRITPQVYESLLNRDGDMAVKLDIFDAQYRKQVETLAGELATSKAIADSLAKDQSADVEMAKISATATKDAAGMLDPQTVEDLRKARVATEREKAARKAAAMGASPEDVLNAADEAASKIPTPSDTPAAPGDSTGTIKALLEEMKKRQFPQN